MTSLSQIRTSNGIRWLTISKIVLSTTCFSFILKVKNIVFIFIQTGLDEPNNIHVCIESFLFFLHVRKTATDISNNILKTLEKDQYA